MPDATDHEDRLKVIARYGGMVSKLNRRDTDALRWALDELKRYRHSLWGVVHNAGRERSERGIVPAWAAVKGATGEGSTVSHRLCVEFGRDPDEEVGSDGSEEEDDDNDDDESEPAHA